jgi:hypothetical protein
VSTLRTDPYVVPRSRLKKNRADGQIVVIISAERERRCRENVSAPFPLAELFAEFTLVFRLSFLSRPEPALLKRSPFALAVLPLRSVPCSLLAQFKPEAVSPSGCPRFPIPLSTM